MHVSGRGKSRESVAFWALGVENVEEKSHSSAQKSSPMQLRWQNEMAMQACSSQACQMPSQNVSVATDLSTHDICLPRVRGFQCPKATKKIKPAAHHPPPQLVQLLPWETKRAHLPPLPSHGPHHLDRTIIDTSSLTRTVPSNSLQVHVDLIHRGPRN